MQFCVEAVQEAITRWGTPAIFNTDQGSQFTSDAFIGLLQRHGIRISMDGKGAWHSIKYEEVYLKAYVNHTGFRGGSTPERIES